MPGRQFAAAAFVVARLYEAYTPMTQPFTVDASYGITCKDLFAGF